MTDTARRHWHRESSALLLNRESPANLRFWVAPISGVRPTRKASILRLEHLPALISSSSLSAFTRRKQLNHCHWGWLNVTIMTHPPLPVQFVCFDLYLATNSGYSSVWRANDANTSRQSQLALTSPQRELLLIHFVTMKIDPNIAAFHECKSCHTLGNDRCASVF